MKNPKIEFEIDEKIVKYFQQRNSYFKEIEDDWKKENNNPEKPFTVWLNEDFVKQF